MYLLTIALLAVAASIPARADQLSDAQVKVRLRGAVDPSNAPPTQVRGSNVVAVTSLQIGSTEIQIVSNNLRTITAGVTNHTYQSTGAN